MRDRHKWRRNIYRRECVSSSDSVRYAELMSGAIEIGITTALDETQWVKRRLGQAESNRFRRTLSQLDYDYVELCMDMWRSKNASSRSLHPYRIETLSGRGRDGLTDPLRYAIWHLGLVAIATDNRAPTYIRIFGDGCVGQQEFPSYWTNLIRDSTGAKGNAVRTALATSGLVPFYSSIGEATNDYFYFRKRVTAKHNELEGMVKGQVDWLVSKGYTKKVDLIEHDYFADDISTYNTGLLRLNTSS